MRLVCDSCGSKYSIGDDRVAGKVFKIRCKKCSHVMVIRGAAPAVETAAPIAEETLAPSGQWHVVIDGEQAGPFAREEVVRRRAAGVLADDAFVWREGMPEWVELASVEEFRAAPAEAAPAPAEPALVNTRNENSLLFTLDKLAQLAAPQPPRPSAPASTAGGPTEGSGLIDIRKIASAYVPQEQRDLRPASTVGSIDDLPSYGPVAFGEPIAIVPALVTRSGTRGDRKLLFALVAAVSMLAILAAILVVVLTRDEAPRTQPVAETPAPGTRVAAVTPAKPPAPSANPPTTDVPPAPVAAPVTPPAPVVAPSPAPVTPPRTPRAPRTQVTPVVPPKPNPLVVTPPAKNECTEVSCIINGFKDPCCVAFKKEPTTKPPTPTTTVTPANLPENLDRVALGKGLATIAAQSCGGRTSAHGDVAVSIKVAPGGGVTGVTIKSSPDPALSACVQAAALKGSFAKSQRGATVAYMWRF